ncbi:MAG: ribosome maturation factor RimP [Alphaproteobacteria bacterium]|nr:ribosome maturation factor RimP [Alphaproteobacteria bacterium]
MRLSALEQRIYEIAAPVLEGLGFDLLWVEYKSDILGIFAENPQTGKLTLDECTAISRELSPTLEVEDPIEGAYRLEVSSAGIDRPLLRESDYERFKGLEAKIEIDPPLEEGQKRFRGRLEGFENGLIQLKTDQGMVDLPFNDVYKAKLVMNDALMEHTKALEENAENKVHII